jgi:hypothetical protein
LGDFYILTNQKWKLGSVIAVEPLKVICISMPAVDRKLKVCRSLGFRNEHTITRYHSISKQLYPRISEDEQIQG